jgi:hypothetical protein
MVHLATIPVTGTGINPARSLGAAVVYNKDKPWDDHVRAVINVCVVALPARDMRLRVCLAVNDLFDFAVDFLGGPAPGRCHRGLLPPVHPPGGRHQGSRLLQEQRVMSRAKERPSLDCVLEQRRSIDLAWGEADRRAREGGE